MKSNKKKNEIRCTDGYLQNLQTLLDRLEAAEDALREYISIKEYFDEYMSNVIKKWLKVKERK